MSYEKPEVVMLPCAEDAVQSLVKGTFGPIDSLYNAPGAYEADE